MNAKWSKSLAYLGSILLWVLISALAIWEVFVVRALVVRMTTRFLVDRRGLTETMATVSAYRVGVAAVLVMSMLALVIVLALGDFRYDRTGKNRTLKTLLWVLGGQLAVLGLAFLF